MDWIHLTQNIAQCWTWMDTGVGLVSHKIRIKCSLSEFLTCPRRNPKPEAEFIGLSAIWTAGFITETAKLSVFCLGDNYPLPPACICDICRTGSFMSADNFPPKVAGFPCPQQLSGVRSENHSVRIWNGLGRRKLLPAIMTNPVVTVIPLILPCYERGSSLGKVGCIILWTLYTVPL